MVYNVDFSVSFEKTIKKLKKKDKALFDQIQKKLIDLVQNPDHYKPLGNVLTEYRRIQFGPFILIFKIEGEVVRIISLDHHDKSY
jgi:mRNA-degrading endonuclease RelE of RelBE toxin-antitoxin system